jgi:tellurite resistance protein TerC
VIWLYAGFIAFVLALLALDLGVFHKRDKADSVKAALGWSALWISIGIAFSLVIYIAYEQHWLGLGTTADQMARAHVAADGTTYYNDGGSAVVKYLTGFFVEKSLAVDNIFVIAMIFSAMAVPVRYQHRVLFWGILGALLMRGIMIGAGAALITRFSWVIYVFGGFLILTGAKMLFMSGDDGDVTDNRLVRWVRRLIPVTGLYHGKAFFLRAGPATADSTDRVLATARTGALLATPLFLALILIEFTDVIFAVDSIPAIFAITTDPFLVFTSNVFAILGLRSLYFALAGMMDRFRYLKVALAGVLVLIGTKMLTHVQLKAWLGEHFNFFVMGAVVAVIAAGVVTSLLATRRQVTNAAVP